MKLHRCHNNNTKDSENRLKNQKIGEKLSRKTIEPSSKKEAKLKTEDFFEEFDKKYSFTFEDDIRTHEFILEADYEGGSKISRGFLDFE
jgi:hypothetical protein